ncbi:molecular chaperone DnaJ [Acinetobacter baumannii]|uniref:molecular chaperone DnaJ n=1 Tax=Acinetobacter baumannii TaxID=470 RepID=UPI00044BFC9D|nr:molecular chaperone DnaJ [Acinetobacter baumannii]EXH87466.1 dnaJ domain protein [Acinetobacter baumannii 318814]MDC5437117.1 molecular chaperone DnaJ [Acinetobacter baumannii]MDO7462765.1 molecular chaperone DnaJ [Acinetobacter baumannii]MDV7377982.1 molecular chaperone DnaJ [Acinetobacter baumannii]HAV5966697.1 molecular chaperone DnaJ [Acinetobacter baumannii]
MSFDLKVSLQQRSEPSAQQKKLNRLIDKIEQQKVSLSTWQNAQAEIQQYIRQKLMPVYSDLHAVLFQQLEQLWSHEFSKADMQQLDEKIAQLAQILKRSKILSAEQLELVKQIDNFYQQHTQESAKKNKKARRVEFEYEENADQGSEFEEDFEKYAAEQQQAREQAKQQRQQQKREQAEQMAAQSLKTVYLKIAAMIHPDREQDETKKLEKTELFQQASQAYEKQDLFYLLKLQLQLEQNKGLGAKELSAEQLRFYKLALDAQSQQLESQIAEILDSFQLAKNVKAEHVHISDVYKAVDADCAELKQQVKWEKERLKHMKKVSGVEMLLGHGVL